MCFRVTVFSVVLSGLLLRSNGERVSIYATDANGRTQKTRQLIVQFNSHVKLTCETDVEGTTLTWEHSITGTTPFVPMVSSPFVSVTEGSNGKLLLELTKSRMSTSCVYRCRGPSAMSSVSVHVVGAINSVNGSVILRPREEILGRLFFFSSHIDPGERPSISCQFVIGNIDPDQTKIIWRGGLCNSHPELYETSTTLNLSSSTASGRLTLIHPELNSKLYGTYQCILKVGPEEAGSSEVKLAIPPVVKNSKSYVYRYPGEKFAHTCEILAQPTVKSPVLWARNKIPLKSDTTSSSKKHLQRIRWDTVTLPDDRIMIDAVELSDRAIYSCFVYNDMGNSTGAVYLQVIKTWSIALPTILVVAELLVLSGSALFYVKFKNMCHRQSTVYSTIVAIKLFHCTEVENATIQNISCQRQRIIMSTAFNILYCFFKIELY
ncbi:hypothetical protein EG68_04928 [Paragonimus skrjabini miyazakii]|uniref:Ig-like domain-containing protein n=1 Tax=Paragonimus skrjabini miyazakii TaxID=59628 RepID=A0A8S9YU42_9TREM|nr:hypothetical protein EG68_04928 [Paragonimus skrjabini miyazakii]